MIIWEDLYYIIDHRDLTDVRLIRKGFDTRIDAKRGLKKLPGKTKEYTIFKGEDIFGKELDNIKLLKVKAKYKLIFCKYDYPEGLTPRQKKRWRIYYRRHINREAKYARLHRDNLRRLKKLARNKK